ncbi:Hypothetical predicted protein [Cloeon dipterum]|uniref:Uncharacterized protein n=2 Tax=Cloeon dipterum TaxID=197152 RepID=A0A8S1C8P1_9INSE|nr:Hypothetical predicted protein [Cloeon dipterum]
MEKRKASTVRNEDSHSISLAGGQQGLVPTRRRMLGFDVLPCDDMMARIASSVRFFLRALSNVLVPFDCYSPKDWSSFESSMTASTSSDSESNQTLQDDDDNLHKKMILSSWESKSRLSFVWDNPEMEMTASEDSWDFTADSGLNQERESGRLKILAAWSGIDSLDPFS